MSVSPMDQHSEGPDDQVFWETVDQGELNICRCQACGQAFLPPQPGCPRCGQESWAWSVAASRGTVYSWTHVHRALGADNREVPYVLLTVDLDDGTRLPGQLIGTETVEIGQRVETCIVDEKEQRVWAFRPVAPGGRG